MNKFKIITKKIYNDYVIPFLFLIVMWVLLFINVDIWSDDSIIFNFLNNLYE